MFHHRLCPGTVAAALAFTLPIRAQVTVDIDLNPSITLNSPVPDAGLALHTSVYSNNFDHPDLPGMITDSGAQMLRFPGGSYSDNYHWSNHSGSGNVYIASGSDFGNFTRVLDQSQTVGMVTANYGSSQQGTMGGQPEEAAAWVAYANGTVGNTHAIGLDLEGNNWYDVDYWARLRSSTVAEYQTWSTTQGRYNPEHELLAIDRDTPIGIEYWEIGNEYFGNGYFGPQWEYDLHAPYFNGDTSDNTGRVGNPLLSPTAYATNSLGYLQAMKAVDPNIQIGVALDRAFSDTANRDILTIIGDQIDFAIVHWYAQMSTIPQMVAQDPGSLPNVVQSVHDDFAAYTSRTPDDYEIHITEFGHWDSFSHPTYDALFVADAYATGFELGVQSMHYLEMNKDPFLGDGAPQPGEAYYAMQMVDRVLDPDDTFIQAASDLDTLRVHAVRKADGSIGILLINTQAGNVTDDAIITLDLAALGVSGEDILYYEYGWDQVAADAPIVSDIFSVTGDTLQLTVKDVTMVGLVLAAHVPEPASGLVLIALACVAALRRHRQGHQYQDIEGVQSLGYRSGRGSINR